MMSEGYEFIRDVVAILGATLIAFRTIPHTVRAVRVDLRADRQARKVGLSMQLEAIERLGGHVSRLESAVSQFSTDLPKLLSEDIPRALGPPRTPPKTTDIASTDVEAESKPGA